MVTKKGVNPVSFLFVLLEDLGLCEEVLSK